MAKKINQQKIPPAPTQQAPIRAMVKVHELILTFDTNKPDQQVEIQAVQLIDEINKLLCKHFKDTFPQIFKDAKKKSKISIVPVTQEELDE